jgi:hypothetical protein
MRSKNQDYWNESHRPGSYPLGLLIRPETLLKLAKFANMIDDKPKKRPV